MRGGERKLSRLTAFSSLFGSAKFDSEDFIKNQDKSIEVSLLRYTEPADMMYLFPNTRARLRDSNIRVEIPESVSHLVRFANIDRDTIVPFSFLRRKSRANFMHLVVFAFDFWDNYIPAVKRFEMLLESLKEDSICFLLLNFPGQAFTVYNPKVPTTNLFAARCLDQVLYYLDSEGKVNLGTDRLHIFGSGFGANVALMFCTFR